MSSLVALRFDPNTPSWFILGILGLAVVFGSLSVWRSRRLRTRVFAKHQYEEPSLAEIRNRLDTINRESPTFSFAAERRANIPFSGQQISVVYGPVVWAGSEVPGRSKSVYAIGDLEQARWMTRSSDIFQPAFSGSKFS